MQKESNPRALAGVNTSFRPYFAADIQKVFRRLLLVGILYNYQKHSRLPHERGAAAAAVVFDRERADNSIVDSLACTTLICSSLPAELWRFSLGVGGVEG
jgi:hypothetical protein